jgi:hypothetical protein
MGIQRRRLSKTCTRKGANARRPVSSCSASDRRTRGEPARLKAPRSSYDPPSATAMGLKAVVLRGTTPADGPRPFRNATSFSKATYARKGDQGVFETRRVGALAFPVGKQPRLGESRPVAVFGNTKYVHCSQLRTIRKRPEATCPGILQKHARGIDALVWRCPRIVVVLQKSVDDVAHDDSPAPVGERRSC